ncbi:hypothetical protein TanjilG_04609 [Lupinus angustifolius]|uniref:RRM domain-containing protein n=1 Tax=Lupinus angustifolius TaxID=3871 RepID=A0A4P1RR08_LUPAN|nr:PREDICTED: glycine-rich RNA-binding protein 3, mitochondrial [Lupinus angustifolius]OIW16074.1 hypothetical protein TanjilG_04609 [Lupinus angustifolius]
MAVIANVVGVNVVLSALPITNDFTFNHNNIQSHRLYLNCSKPSQIISSFPFSLSLPLTKKGSCFLLPCLPSDSESLNSSSITRKVYAVPSLKLFVSGLSFRTTEESLRNAFENFGQLVEVNLVMDKIANRPRGFAFLRYATEDESHKAIEGMHGKFLDGRVIFVEVAKPRSELRQEKTRPKF